VAHAAATPGEQHCSEQGRGRALDSTHTSAPCMTPR
jgi:hypothetical protein